MLILLFGSLDLMSLSGFSQNLWEVDKNEEGIVVYTREEGDSGFKSFKAVMTADASPGEIIEVLKNADDYASWYGYTKSSKTLSREENVQYNYVETSFPWPYSNRDMVYKMSVKMSEPTGVLILLEGVRDYIPEKMGIVRMQKAEGFILLIPVGEKTEITYQFHSEPGDGIPAWLANRSISELPFNTFVGLKKVLERQKKTEK